MKAMGIGVFCLMSLLASAGAVEAATKVSVSVGTVTDDSASITWSRTQDSCFHEYSIGYKRPIDFTWTQGASFANAETTTYVITGLRDATQYEVFVRDTDCFGSTDSDARSFTTLTTQGTAPPAPPITISSTTIVALAGLLAVVILALVGMRMVRKKRARGATQIPVPSIAPVVAPPTPAMSVATAAAGSPMKEVAQPSAGVKFCSQCGSKVAGPFCASCGAKVT